MPPRGRRRKRRAKRKGKVPSSFKRYVKEQINEDLTAKFHDRFVSISPNWNGVFEDLSAVGIGTSDTTRIGDDIRPTHLSLHYAVTGQGSTINLVRVIILQTRCRATAPPPTVDLIELTRQGDPKTPMSQFFFDGRGQYKVLHDKLHTLSANGNNNSVHRVSISKFAYKKIQFYAGSPIDKDHGIYFYAFSDVNASIPSVRITSRLHYTG